MQSVSRFLGDQNSGEYADSKRKYDLACLKSDLMLHLKVLPDADEEYQHSFVQWANEFLDETDLTIIDELPADARVKWLLVRERRLSELLEVIEFERRGGLMPVQRRFRRYLNYPYLGDREVGLDKKAYRLDKELSLHGSLSGARWSPDSDLLTLTGTAYVRFINVHKKHMSVKAIALRNKKQGRMMITTAKTVYAPQATEDSKQNRYCYDWAGFEARIDTARLKRKGQWVEGTWDVAAGVLSRGLFRYRGIDRGGAGSAANPPYRYVDKNTRILPVFLQGKLKLRVEIVRCRITQHRLVGDQLELRGVYLGPKVPEWGQLRVTSLSGAGRHDARVHFTPGGDGWCTFSARIPLSRLVPKSRVHAGTDADVPQSWNMGANGWKTTFHVEGRKMTMYPVVAEDTPDGHYPMPATLQTREHDREVVVHRNGSGYLVLFERATLPVASRCEWRDDGSLLVQGRYLAADQLTEDEYRAAHLVVRSRAHGAERPVPLTWEGDEFRAVLAPAAMRTLAGDIPLAAGRWDFFLRRQDLSAVAREDRLEDLMVKIEQDLIETFPQDLERNERRYEIQAEAYDRLSLLVHSAMPDQARGPYRQKILRTKAYPDARRQPVRDAVLFDAFKGTQYSDSPRALHEELLRRRVDLEQLWVVRDDQVQVPPTATPVRMWSPQWYEALATSRYVVANNHLPDWFQKRDGQVVVQTWHGTPLKKIGHDIESIHFADQRYLERVEKEVENWDMLVSPNSFSTPILQRAFGFPGEMVESGYPRNDILRRPDTEDQERRIRRRIGLPEGKRVVLYAPTWRDDQFYAPGKYKLDFRIDLAAARAELGDDHVLMVRRHPNVVDPVPGAGDGFVFDVSDYPDMADLSLITDVMITDYSSLMFDYVNTGRPILFFTYDLDHYRDTLRGFYFDFEGSAPGPCSTRPRNWWRPSATSTPSRTSTPSGTAGSRTSSATWTTGTPPPGSRTGCWSPAVTSPRPGNRAARRHGRHPAHGKGDDPRATACLGLVRRPPHDHGTHRRRAQAARRRPRLRRRDRVTPVVSAASAGAGVHPDQHGTVVGHPGVAHPAPEHGQPGEQVVQLVPRHMGRPRRPRGVALPVRTVGVLRPHPRERVVLPGRIHVQIPAVHDPLPGHGTHQRLQLIVAELPGRMRPVAAARGQMRGTHRDVVRRDERAEDSAPHPDRGLERGHRTHGRQRIRGQQGVPGPSPLGRPAAHRGAAPVPPAPQVGPELGVPGSPEGRAHRLDIGRAGLLQEQDPRPGTGGQVLHPAPLRLPAAGTGTVPVPDTAHVPGRHGQWPGLGGERTGPPPSPATVARTAADATAASRRRPLGRDDGMRVLNIGPS
ncbi:hypothetical protein SHKM778_28430 [Streptomyces sp. KM77-8]|uniref:Uncharacterized protein n=1 Tax=Streptomyces haneummycinicus TaxID=3074435 RepID=A0AAT9HH14_9ACTN